MGRIRKIHTLQQITAKNIHTSTHITKLTDNGPQLLKLKDHSLSKTIGFTEYNFHSDKPQHAQYMFHKVQHIQKFMLTYKHLRSLLLHSGNTCTILHSVELHPFQDYMLKTLMNPTYLFQNK